MTRNVGNLERVARTIVALSLAVGTVLASLQPGLRIALGATAAYVLFTAVTGSCLGYRMLGRLTCRS